MSQNIIPPFQKNVVDTASRFKPFSDRSEDIQQWAMKERDLSTHIADRMWIRAATQKPRAW